MQPVSTSGYYRSGMSTFFLVASLLLSAISAVSIVALVRRRDPRLARVALPAAVLLLVVQMALGHWSVAAFLLLAVIVSSAGALAARGRDRGLTWIALAAFAVAGIVGGFGVLAQGLCAAGDSYNCGGTPSNLLAIGGWATAIAMYGYLSWGALRS